MSKRPPQRDIERLRGLITADDPRDADDTSADIHWARQTLDGGEHPPPGDALRPEVAYALVEELIQRQTPQAAQMLGRLARSTHRDVAKAARTGLHRLRSHKVEVEVPVKSQGEQHEGTGTNTQQALPGMATIYDSRWERLVWLADDAPRGVRVFQGRLSATFGLLELNATSTTRKEYRTRTRQILDELGGEMVPPQDARWLVHDAAQRCSARGRSLPRGYALTSQRIGAATGGDHPALRLELLPGADLIPLYDLPELKYWYPDGDFLRRLAHQLEEAGTSQIVLSDAQRAQRRADIVDRSVEEFFDAVRCQTCRLLLLDTAHLFMVKEETRERARLLRTAADQLLGTPREVALRPFPRHLVERIVQRPADAHDHPHEHPHDPDSSHQGGGLILP